MSTGFKLDNTKKNLPSRAHAHRTWSFSVAVLQLEPISNARAQPLVCSLNIFCFDVGVAVAVLFE